MPNAVVFTQPVSQTIGFTQGSQGYNQVMYPQGVTPGFVYPVNNSYIPNVNESKNFSLEKNDATVLESNKNAK